MNLGASGTSLLAGRDARGGLASHPSTDSLKSYKMSKRVRAQIGTRGIVPHRMVQLRLHALDPGSRVPGLALEACATASFSEEHLAPAVCCSPTEARRKHCDHFVSFQLKQVEDGEPPPCPRDWSSHPHAVRTFACRHQAAGSRNQQGPRKAPLPPCSLLARPLRPWGRRA